MAEEAARKLLPGEPLCAVCHCVGIMGCLLPLVGHALLDEPAQKPVLCSLSSRLKFNLQGRYCMCACQVLCVLNTSVCLLLVEGSCIECK